MPGTHDAPEATERLEALAECERPSASAEIWHPLSGLHAAALDHPTIGLLVFDRILRPVHITSQVRPLLGIADGAPLERIDILDLFPFTKLDAQSQSAAEAAILDTSGEGFANQVTLRAVDDPVRCLQMTLRELGSGYRIAAFEEVTSGPQAASSAARNDVPDLLTGLLSRRSFENAVTAALARIPEPALAVVLLDLDRFKAVNDTLGHAAGDTVLRLAAERILSSVRKDDLVARLGGDEFAVLVDPAPTTAEPIAIANRILDVVQRTYLVEGQLVNVGTSLGIALSPAHGNTCRALMINADLALYKSKTSGKATFHFFDAEMQARAQARRTSELELRSALALRQMEVHYQPQVDIHTGKLIGFEALVRWRHPERGLIPPGSFLPMAEEIGVIVPLGEWVLRTACRQAMTWGKDVLIAVNASPLQFETGRFADTVRRALRSTGLAGSRLEIEVTEGILLKNDDSTIATLHALRAMDVRIAMDDFGTGYASLSQLARFPFDKIKIDRSLSGFEGDNPKHRAIVRAIAGLGTSLGVSTMAEGVENVAQLERLQSDGCSSVQGYFFSRPVPACDLENLIEELRSHTTQEISL